MSLASYLVPASSLKVEEVIKGSQFITRVSNVGSAEQAKAFIKSVNQRFPEASHHCWAYIVGNPQSTTLIGCSDDGEPSGTAGKPMLHVLQHAHIGDIVVVCTRYFGGTKLGTGGLARAYGGGTKLALDSLSVIQKIHYCGLACELDYAQLDDFQHLLKDFTHQELRLDYQTKVHATFEIAVEQAESFKHLVANQFKGQIEWNIT